MTQRSWTSRWVLGLAGLAALALLAGRAPEAAEAAPDPASLVKAEMVAELDQVIPGKPLWIGVKYTIAPGWHIYWENPGDSGLATDLTVDPGAGLSAGPAQFPGPERFDLPGDVVNYGYHREAALLSVLTPRPQLRTGERVQIKWSSSWLVCKEACLRGGAEGSLDLPVGQASAAKKTGALDPFVAALPQPLRAAEGAEGWQGSGAAARYRVSVRGASVLTLFPNRALAEGPPGVEASGDSVSLSLDPAKYAANAAGLGGVVRAETPAGPRYYSFTVPWPPPARP